MIGEAHLHLLRDLEERRCRATIAVDLPELDRLLDDDLVWIHGSGRVEDKAMLLAMIGKERPYRALTISQHSVREIGSACISTGTVEITLALRNAPPTYFNLFTNIWLLADGQPRLVHAQSTRCSPPEPR